MMEHKNVKITLFEGTSYNEDGLEVSSEKPFYVAGSKFGKSLANQPQKALDGAKEQIDRALSK
jgi:hypothetical protein